MRALTVWVHAVLCCDNPPSNSGQPMHLGRVSRPPSQALRGSTAACKARQRRSDSHPPTPKLSKAIGIDLGTTNSAIAVRAAKLAAMSSLPAPDCNG